MKQSGRLWFFLFFTALLGARFWQENRAFEKERALFPEPAKGLFQAWIAEEPEVLFQHGEGGHDTGRLGGFYQPFVGEVRAVAVLLGADGKSLPPVRARISFRLSPQNPQPLLSYGDTVEIQGKILPPPPAMNPGQFDYAHYLRTRGVAYVIYAAPGKWKKVEPPEVAASRTTAIGAAPRHDSLLKTNHGNFLIRWSCSLKRRCQDSIYGFLPFPENALLDGLLLGERGPLPSAMVEDFMATGTVHILAVSGMMTAFIAGLMFLVLRAAQAPRKAAAGLTILGVVFFIFMTGAHPPVCRAGLFSILALAAVLFERKIQGGVLLLTTVLVLGIAQPLVLEDLSFQISFLATAGLMVFSGPWMEKLSFLWEPAALLAVSTAAAQMSVWCLLIYFFNQLSIYSPLANLVIVPLALFATAAGLTAIAGGFLHPFLGKVFGAACWAPLKLLILLAGRMALWPGAQWVVASPNGIWTAAFHLLFLFLLFFYWPRPKPEKPSRDWVSREAFNAKGRRISSRVFGIFLLVSALGAGAEHLRSQPLRLAFLAVGHGNAVVLRPPQGGVFIFDGGKETTGPDRYNPVVAYLRHLGIQRVAGILDTHPDADHVGGLLNLLSAYPVSEAVVSPQAQADSEVYRRFTEAVQAKAVTFLKLKDGDRWAQTGPASVEILHPPGDFRPRVHADNNLSLVSLVSFGGLSAVLPGDIEKEGLLKLFQDHHPFPKVDWLMAPHHGRASGEPALCAAGFHPRFVVLSDGKDYPLARDQYGKGAPGSLVLSTAEEGAIEVEMNQDGKGRYRSFRRGDWKEF